MLCPVDGHELMMTDRAGIEIDYCPKCRGVWLDRGELDKLIERSADSAVTSVRSTPTRYDDETGYKRKNDDDYYDDDNRRDPRKRRGSFLGDIFDIFD